MAMRLSASVLKRSTATMRSAVLPAMGPALQNRALSVFQRQGHRRQHTNARGKRQSFRPKFSTGNFAVGIAASLGLAYLMTEDAEAASVDYNAVRQAIADTLDDDSYEAGDGSYGPVFVRLAWHASGTFNQFDGTGGSEGAKMRFSPEADHGANAGLHIARARLEPIKAKFPGISYADLWTLAGSVAIEEMGGPKIAWRPGRTDAADGKQCTPDGRLPDAARAQDHIRAIFYRMGFNDQEIVALVGAHALGRCHEDRSGFWGPWTRSPTTFSNSYFTELLNQKWVPKKWSGPHQYVDAATREIMMLPADLALIQDADFKQYVDLYAKDENKFFQDFAAAWKKLIENGVPAFQQKKGWFW